MIVVPKILTHNLQEKNAFNMYLSKTALVNEKMIIRPSSQKLNLKKMAI